jgi:predicted transcriptional regulator
MVNNFQEKIANSFIKVKEDIESMKNELEKLKRFLLLKNNEILYLKQQISAQIGLISDLEAKIEQKSKSSIGNDRVINNDQQSSTIINNAQKSLKINDVVENKPIRILIENKFRSLTDREFSVFMAIYQLEEELGKVTYNDIAIKLNLTEATVRNFITGLMNKEIPIIKERIFNKKAFFYVKKDFKELNLASRLLELRQLSKNRVTK